MNPELHSNQTESTVNTANENPMKKYILYLTIAGLVVSALISVIAVLIGEFNEFISRALFTTFSSVIHSLFLLSLVTNSSKNKRKSDIFLTNVVIGIVVASFATSILGIWQVVDGTFVFRTYTIIIYTLFLCMLAKALLSSTLSDKVVRGLAYTSLGLSIILYALIIPTAFTDTGFQLPDIYYRFLAASAILTGTSAVLTSIFDKLRNKH